MTYCVGLTGGIGSGKSKAADMFAELGAGIVDTDVISHALTAPGGRAMPEIERLFGRDYVREDGALDRSRMRSLVFADPEAKRRLEGLLHPMIRADVAQAVADVDAPYALLVVPLLLETGAYRDLIARVLVVDCPEHVQIARTMARSGLAEDEVRRVISAQLPRAERLRRADDVIANDGDISTLRTQVEALHACYLAAAGR